MTAPRQREWWAQTHGGESRYVRRSWGRKSLQPISPPLGAGTESLACREVCGLQPTSPKEGRKEESSVVKMPTARRAPPTTSSTNQGIDPHPASGPRGRGRVEGKESPRGWAGCGSTTYLLQTASWC